jgi:hypothetical protein
MISPNLKQAFAATRYQVALDGKWLTLTTGAPCPEPLAAWLRAQGSPIAWLITAYNPGARMLAATTNAARHAVLRDWVAQRGLACLDSVNVDPTQKWPSDPWPDEPGLLIAGLEEDLARALAGRFGQLAMLAVRPDAPVALVWLPQ